VRATETALPGVLLVESPVHGDSRGSFTEVFHAEKFAAIGLPTTWVQDNHSRSAGGILRGLHYQLEQPQGKLVRAVTGAIYDVAVDVRRSSPHFGKWVGVTLREGDGRQLWIPPGFAHGFFVLSQSADVAYKCTTLYHAGSDRSLAWNDPTIGIEWPLEGATPSLSAKDAAAPLLANAELFP
jgi:dTDP-4-dehydrorhamnose 3,5-epimerase